MNKAIITTSVHRFRDYVAVSIHDGPTVYLNAMQADEFGRAIARMAKDVVKCKFQESTEPSHDYNMEGSV